MSTRSGTKYRLRVVHRYANEHLNDGEIFHTMVLYEYMNNYITPYGAKSKLSCVTKGQLRNLLKRDPCFEHVDVNQYKYRAGNHVVD